MANKDFVKEFRNTSAEITERINNIRTLHEKGYVSEVGYQAQRLAEACLYREGLSYAKRLLNKNPKKKERNAR